MERRTVNQWCNPTSWTRNKSLLKKAENGVVRKSVEEKEIKRVMLEMTVNSKQDSLDTSETSSNYTYTEEESLIEDCETGEIFQLKNEHQTHFY